MQIAQPLSMSRGAWKAIGEEVVAPAVGDDVLSIALDAVWRQATPEGARVTVWLSPELALVLARLLDGHPELADALG